jgi:hypothetical protein
VVSAMLQVRGGGLGSTGGGGASTRGEGRGGGQQEAQEGGEWQNRHVRVCLCLRRTLGRCFEHIMSCVNLLGVTWANMVSK